MINLYFQQQVYLQALKSPLLKKYGVVIIHQNKIISVGYNKFKPNVVIGKNIQCVL
jgi:deoxycytidylate deaminase